MRALEPLGIARLELGDLTGARTALRQGLPALVAVGDRFIFPIGLSGFAGLAAKTGRHRRALRLSGAAEACRDSYESALPEPIRAYLECWLAPALKTVGAAAPKLIAEGRQMTLTAALGYALGPSRERSACVLPGRRHAADLLPDARAPVAATPTTWAGSWPWSRTAAPPISSSTPTAPNASPSPSRSWASPTRWSGSAP